MAAEGSINVYGMSASGRKIAKIIADIKRNGFSKEKPFSIGNVDNRVKAFASSNNVALSSGSMYITSHAIAHATRDSKRAIGIAVSDRDLIEFPNKKSKMDVFFDGQSFIYTDYKNKFVVHPNYEMKIDRNRVKKVNFITAGVVTDKREFLDNVRYKKIS